MDHAGHLSLIFCLDRDAVPVVTHRNHRILQIGAVRAVYHIVQLCVNALAGCDDAPSHLVQAGTGVIGKFIFPDDTPPDLLQQRRDRCEQGETLCQRVGSFIFAFTAAEALQTAGTLQQGSDAQKFL